MGLIEES